MSLGEAIRNGAAHAFGDAVALGRLLGLFRPPPPVDVILCKA